MSQTLVVADYKALEVVVLADLTLRLFDDNQLAVSIAPGAPDIHCENARLVFGKLLGWRIPATFVVDGKPVICNYAGETVDAIPTAEFKSHPYGAFLRDAIKTVFYGWCYGKRGFGFATLPDGKGGMVGEDIANGMVDGLTVAMPGLGKWESWVQEYVDEYHGIYSLGGRWCDLSAEMTGEDWMKRRAYRRALNFPCQASGADIVGDAMVRVASDQLLTDCGYRTVLQVHDELVLRGPITQVDYAENALSSHMTNATANGTVLLVPLQVSVGHGDNYYDAK